MSIGIMARRWRTVMVTVGLGFTVVGCEGASASKLKSEKNDREATRPLASLPNRGADMSSTEHDVPAANDSKFNPLRPEEARVILGKGTEPPFIGEYTNLTEPGTYICRRCNAPLYSSEGKFHSECGWPSFDDEIPGAVKRETDRDGFRTEYLSQKTAVETLGYVFWAKDSRPRTRATASTPYQSSSTRKARNSRP